MEWTGQRWNIKRLVTTLSKNISFLLYTLWQAAYTLIWLCELGQHGVNKTGQTLNTGPLVSRSNALITLLQSYTSFPSYPIKQLFQWFNISIRSYWRNCTLSPHTTDLNINKPGRFGSGIRWHDTSIIRNGTFVEILLNTKVKS